VLQPSAGLPFVHKGEEHAMLPPGPNLYKLVQPLEEGCDVDGGPAGGLGKAGAGGCCSCTQRKKLTVGDAMLAFMNTPHPIETLGDPRAYGHQGAISRYHNPVNYAQALAALL
jgi:hypothetical protein